MILSDVCVQVPVRSSPSRDKQLVGHRLLSITWVVLSSWGCKKFISNKWHDCMCYDCDIDKLVAYKKFRQSLVVTQCRIIDHAIPFWEFQYLTDCWGSSDWYFEGKVFLEFFSWKFWNTNIYNDNNWFLCPPKWVLKILQLSYGSHLHIFSLSVN